MLYDLFKRLAFKFDPELIHAVTFQFFHYFPQVFAYLFPRVKMDSRYGFRLKCGLFVPFPIGVASGLDKDCIAFKYFECVGFGTVEGGTITPYAQPGNPRPRLWRMIKDESLRNNMGFPNKGMEAIYRQLKSEKYHIPIGISIGKNKDTPTELAFHDYKLLSDRFKDIADYLVINLSSPNTPGLRDLQQIDNLKKILDNIVYPKYLFLKISPDLTEEEVYKIYQVAISYRLSGIVATNTSSMPELGAGGVSGKLLYAKSKKIRDQLLNLSRDSNLDIIGCGGLSEVNEILDFWRNGGRLIQVYTSFIFKGPSILKEVKSIIDQYHIPLEELFKTPTTIVSSDLT